MCPVKASQKTNAQHLRTPSGKVALGVKDNRLRLRLPRKLYGGKQVCLYLGWVDSPENRVAAEQKAREIELDILAGYFDPTLKKYRPKTYGDAFDLADLWEKYTKHKAKDLAKSTIARDYKKVANRIQKLPGDPVAARAYLLKYYSQEIARRTLKAISCCMEWAVLYGHAEANPYRELTRDIKPSRNKNRSRQAFSSNEVTSILSAIESDRFCSKYAPTKHSSYFGFVRFISLTGCRLEEAIALRWVHVTSSHIEFVEAIPTDVKILQETKTHQERQFPINKQLRALLDSLERSGELVFPAPGGGIIDCHNLLPRLWKGVILPLMEAGEVRQYLPLYNLRHSAITGWIKAGVPISQIAFWVGNSPEVLLKHYAAVIEDMLPPES
jgi:integrase